MAEKKVMCPKCGSDCLVYGDGIAVCVNADAGNLNPTCDYRREVKTRKRKGKK